jgi:hypothetical protein
VVNQAAGTVAIAIAAVTTASLAADEAGVYDVKCYRSDGEPTRLTASTWLTNSAVTLATT